MGVQTLENQLEEIVLAFEQQLRQGAAKGVQKALGHLVKACREKASKDDPIKKPTGRTTRYGSIQYRDPNKHQKGAPMRRLSGDNVKEYEAEMGQEAYQQSLGFGTGDIVGRMGTNVLSTPSGMENFELKKNKKKPRGASKKEFPYSAYHEGDTSLGAGAGQHPVIQPTMDEELNQIGEIIVGEIK